MKKLGPKPSRVLRARLSGDDVETFLLRCAELELTPSEIIRRQIRKWLAEQRKLQKIKQSKIEIYRLRKASGK